MSARRLVPRVEPRRLCDRASSGVHLQPDDATRAIIIDLHGDERVTSPPDPLEMTKGDPVRSGDRRDGSRTQVDSRHTVAMRHEGHLIVSLRRPRLPVPARRSARHVRGPSRRNEA